MHRKLQLCGFHKRRKFHKRCSVLAMRSLKVWDDSYHTIVPRKVAKKHHFRIRRSRPWILLLFNISSGISMSRKSIGKLNPIHTIEISMLNLIHGFTTYPIEIYPNLHRQQVERTTENCSGRGYIEIPRRLP